MNASSALNKDVLINRMLGLVLTCIRHKDYSRKMELLKDGKFNLKATTQIIR